MIDFLKTYLDNVLAGEKVEAIINGLKYKGTVNDEISIEYKEPYHIIILKIDGEIEKIPVLLDKTKIRVGKETFVFQTERHNSVIEII